MKRTSILKKDSKNNRNFWNDSKRVSFEADYSGESVFSVLTPPTTISDETSTDKKAGGIINNIIDYLPASNRIDISNSVKELLETEKCYVAFLRYRIERYVDNYGKVYRQLTPICSKYDLFGNIEEIFAFHRDFLLPLLETYDDDIGDLGEKLNSNLDKCFDYYMEYILCRAKASRFLKDHRRYLQEQSPDMEDFINEPLQRLLTMRSVFGEIIAGMTNLNDEDGGKYVQEEIQIWSSLYTRLSAQIKTITGASRLQFVVGLDKKFDILKQGKFLKANIFNVHCFSITEPTTGELFKGKVFLFEKSLLITQEIDGGRKGIIDQYWSHTLFSGIKEIKSSGGKKSFEIGLSEEYITFWNDQMTVCNEWNDLLVEYWMK